MPEEKTAEELAEETAAAAQVADKTEEQKPEEKPKAAEPANQQLVEVLSKLQESLKPGMTPEQRETQLAALEESSGFTRKQLAFMSTQVKSTAVETNLPVYQELGKAKAEKALGAYSEALIKRVEEEMQNQPAAVQADPRAWEQLAYLVKGKFMDTVKPSGTKVVAGAGGDMNPGLTEGGRRSGGGAPKTSKQYSADEQTIINQYFGGNAEAFEKRKSEKRVGLPDGGGQPGGNAADKELSRLTNGSAVVG